MYIEDFPGGTMNKNLPDNAGDTDSIPGQGAGIPHASQPKNKNIKQKQHCNKFNQFSSVQSLSLV